MLTGFTGVAVLPEGIVAGGAIDIPFDTTTGAPVVSTTDAGGSALSTFLIFRFFCAGLGVTVLLDGTVAGGAVDVRLRVAAAFGSMAEAEVSAGLIFRFF